MDNSAFAIIRGYLVQSNETLIRIQLEKNKELIELKGKVNVVDKFDKICDIHSDSLKRFMNEQQEVMKVLNNIIDELKQ